MKAVLPVVGLLLLWGALLFVAALFIPGLGHAVAVTFEQIVTEYPAKVAAARWPDNLGLVIGLVGGLFCAPVIAVIGGVWKLLGQSSNPFDQHLWGDWWLPFGVAVILLSWLLWSFTVSRSLRLLGLWSPFLGTVSSRRWMLQSWVRFWQWIDLGRLGRGPVASWAGFFEVISSAYRDGDVFLGRPRIFRGAFGLLRPVGIPTEKHMVTVAGTGAGKSTAALIPNLCLHRGSLLCVDPKGELATITAARRGNGRNGNGEEQGVSGLGQKVFVVDPFKTVAGWPSASYNVFDEMARVASYDPDAPVSYAGKIADALVKPLSDKESYFDDAAKTFIRGLVLLVFVAAPEGEKTLVTLRRWIMEGDAQEYEKQVAAGVIDGDKMTPFDVLLEKMKLGRGEGLYGEVIAAAASSLLMMGPNQMGSVLTTAQEHTAFLDTPELRRISLRSDFLLEDLKTGAVSVYLCLPLNAVTGKEGRWLRMFILLTIDMMMRVKKAPKPPILLAVDEFPSLGHLEGISVVAPVLRSYGVRFWAVAQDMMQLAHVYPGDWAGFIGNAEAVQFLGIVEPYTVDWLVKRIGEHVVDERVMEQGKIRHVKTIKPLLDPDQAARLLAKEWKNQIVWRGSRRPMLLRVAPYFDYLPFWYYAADPRFKEPLRRRLWRQLM